MLLFLFGEEDGPVVLGRTRHAYQSLLVPVVVLMECVDEEAIVDMLLTPSLF
jgi:hypothetical protein